MQSLALMKDVYITGIKTINAPRLMAAVLQLRVYTIRSCDSPNVCTATCINLIMGCLHDPANGQQTSSKCIKNTRANAGRLLVVC